MGRTVVWFSAGAASAVAAKIALDINPDALLVYTDPGNEHPDNRRFITDVERWLEREVQILGDERYADAWDLWSRDKYLVGVQGARCSLVLKKRVRQRFEDPSDRQVFGYTAEEEHRADRFRVANPDVDLWTPLIERRITKADCLAIVAAADIELPVMYQLGYRNNNCIGCVKGGMGYWNKIRNDFPHVFERMARLERELDIAILHDKNGRLFLDELQSGRGRYSAEPEVECSLLCTNILEGPAA